MRLKTDAADTIVVSDDDFTDARWFSREELAQATFSPPTAFRLAQLGYIAASLC